MTTRDDHLDLVARLLGAADNLPTPEEARRKAVDTGLTLGLPRVWLHALPTIDLLPEGYRDGPGSDRRYEPDSFLKFKGLEHAVRSGRVADLSPDDLDLIAEALENESAGDGPRWMHDRMEDVLFILAWPKRTYALHVDLRIAAEGILDALDASPSSLLYSSPADIDQEWQSATYRIHALDPDVVLPETSPWPDLAALLRAVADRIAEGFEAGQGSLRSAGADVAQHLLEKGWSRERVIADLAINTTEIERMRAAGRFPVRSGDGQQEPLFGTHLPDAAAVWLRAEVTAAMLAARDRLPAERIAAEVIGVAEREQQ
ncbi:hypothetical protein VY88_33035 [Azospirillum thiophilum]|uniref:Uncharacterized protein n=1 Tax=Azospirillum thiophilum TaxID=528244 RepID=A0AAC8ZWT8_9PROT|nr:hypothetical protein [Azospirillum thiophilum]ALG75713.1 hypothetical protein AL072_32740 [Azospirillum thiophilum]KJR61225.1 hypothetical protein VY88_33035 [Azospirillum thiophilum]